MTLMVAVFAVGAMSAQITKAPAKSAPVAIEKKHECKDHKDGKPCTKPADQQCDDCKAKAAAAQKHECKKAEGQKCEKAEGMKHECKEGMKKCDKAEGMKKCDKAEGMKKCEGMKAKCDKAEGLKKHECKEGMKHECKKAEGQKCDKANAEMKDCCKDKKMEGKKCDKPADQQCPDCKAEGMKKDAPKKWSIDSTKIRKILISFDEIGIFLSLYEFYATQTDGGSND